MALDADDLKKIGELISAATSAERLTPIVAEAAKAHVTSAIGGLKLDEKFQELADKIKPAEDPKKEEKGKDGKGDSPEVAQLRAAIEAEKKAREEAEAGRRRDALEGAARDALIKAGVPGDRVRHAMAVLKADGVIEFTADGKPGWKGKDKHGVDTILPIEEGASSWAKTDDGKHFLPPANVQGDGSGAGNKTPIVRDGKIDLAAIQSKLNRALASGLPEV